MKIVIGGDVVPTETSEKYFRKDDFIECFDDDFKRLWLGADLRLFNLECPLIDKNKAKPIMKSGPNLYCNEECIKGIKSLSPNLVCLANNHILDYGQVGLKNTQRLLAKNGIAITGVIKNGDSESQVFYCSKDSVKIGVYNFCETEFCNATNNEAGADYYRENNSCSKISEIKRKCDFLIVIFHAGKEFYRYPSPKLQDRCRAFIDAGADFIVCQHSHCIGCEERYKKGIILYGQGNFLFDSGTDEFWDNGLLVQLDVRKDCFFVNYILVERLSPVVRIAKDKKILDNFRIRSERVSDRKIIEEEYGRFARKSLDGYLEKIYPRSFGEKVYRRIFGKYPVRDLSWNYYLDLLNSVRCEAHSELLARGLEEIVLAEKDKTKR